MSTPTPPSTDDESVVQHLMRSAKNAVTKCFGCVQTSDEKAKIKYKEYQIETRKKAFGVAYINTLRNSNSADGATLQGCIDEALADIAKMEKEIAELQNEIDRVEGATREKILPKPGVAAAASPTAAATTTATPAVVPPPSETAAVVIPAPVASADVAGPPPALVPPPPAAPAVEMPAPTTTKPDEYAAGMEEVDMSQEAK
jgi:hypothetical protein